MQTQPRFWGRADTASRQPELFDRGGRVSALNCSECGSPMEETPSGFVACPHGHGKLNLAFVEDGPDGWYADLTDGQ